MLYCNIHALYYIIATGPATVDGISVTKAGPDVLVIVWNETQNSVSYEIEYRATGETAWSITFSNVANTTLDNLELGITYEVRVRVREMFLRLGNGPWSSIVNGTTCDGK